MFDRLSAGATVFHGAHPEEVSSFVNEHIGPHRLEMLGQRECSSTLSFKEFAGFGLSQLHYGNHVRIKSPALDAIYHLQIVIRGECVWQQAGDRMLVRRGEALMVNPYEGIDLEYSPDCEKLIIKVPEQALKNLGAVANGHLPGGEIRFAREPVDLHRCRALINIIEAVISELVEAQEEDISLMYAPYREIILKKVLKIFPSNWDSQQQGTAYSPALKHMLEYIEHNYRSDIHIEELSSVSNMSERSIYNAFAKAFSTTPKCYIKQLKLRKLRQDLLQGRCRNVTEVALDYGFCHLGRFSADYRKAFGELPSETMKMAG